jgi:hypothetical protein
MADQPVAALAKASIVERRVEHFRAVAPNGPPTCTRAHRLAGKRAAATSSINLPSVMPNATSPEQPAGTLMLLASWIGIVLRERPMPKSA